MKVIDESMKNVSMQCLLSKRPEFIVVYGRRRIGKTYLIREYFNNTFTFYTTGISGIKTKDQLRAFHESLCAYGHDNKDIPKDWFEAFMRLKELLTSNNVYREPINHKKVVFLDELPWMDTARSDFKSALDYFWNSYASAQEDIVFIVCGSAASWIISNVLTDRSGFHNRVTRQLHLLPLTLGECEELMELNDIVMTRNQLIECYMVFGGVPHYLNLLDSRLSLAQNITELCFKEYGGLHNEYNKLFYSLFHKPEKHMEILAALSKKRDGLTRTELSCIKSIGGGSILSKNLRELEECGFIRKYISSARKPNEKLYQVIDPFTLFSIQYINNQTLNSWNEYINSPAYNSWKETAFEIVCLNHIKQIKASLGIQGIETKEFIWRSQLGTHIDLIIQRKDGVINLCEMKYTQVEYALDASEHDKILNRLASFRNEMNCKDAIHVTLICAGGYRYNKYSSIIQNIIVGEDLFS